MEVRAYVCLRWNPRWWWPPLHVSVSFRHPTNTTSTPVLPVLPPSLLSHSSTYCALQQGWSWLQPPDVWKQLQQHLQSALAALEDASKEKEDRLGRQSATGWLSITSTACWQAGSCSGRSSWLSSSVAPLPCQQAQHAVCAGLGGAFFLYSVGAMCCGFTWRGEGVVGQRPCQMW